MTVFIDVSGEEYLALTDLNYSHKVNGEKSLKGTIYSNDEVINKIDRGWSLKHNDEIYYITYALPIDNGEAVTVEFDAIHEFFYKMGKSSVYTTLDGSNTAIAYLDLIFTNSGYTYSLGATVPAFEKENFGMKNRLALFNDFINSTNTEFKVVGKTVTIVEKIGSDLSTIVRKGFNLQELGLEHNIGDFVTYAKGFGAYKDPDDETKGRLEVEYRSPLADVYGVLEADPIVDERYTIAENLTAKLKDLVESSYSISVSLTIEDLQKAGYEYGFPNPGDYIMAINEDLDFQQKIRIVSIDESIDVLGNSLDKTVTCSSLNLVDQKNQADASNSQTWNDISNGVKPIPSDWLADAIQTATSDLLNARTELKFTSNGILAIDKSDSNRIVIMNSSGLGVSTDGGKTFGDAITAEGINASAIKTGILKAISIEGVTISGSTIETTGTNGKLMMHDGVFSAYGNDGKLYGKIEPYLQEDGAGMQIDGNGKGVWIFGNAKQTSSPRIIATQNSISLRTSRLNMAMLDDTVTFDGGNIRLIPDDGDEVYVSGDFRQTNGMTRLMDVVVSGNLSVGGTKNAIHETSYGIRATPAYELAESYLGDIGRNKTSNDREVWIPIETIFKEIVNTKITYEVFLQPYGQGNVWVSEFKEDGFIVSSDQPNLLFAWEVKAKRKKYENDRLVLTET